MFSPEKKFANPFENKPTVAQLRSDYQTMLTGDRIRKQAESSSLMNDPRIAKGFQQREQDRAFQASKMVLEQVGRLNADELSRAILPENLKDVLLRGGARLDTFFILGKYEDEDIDDEADKRFDQIEKAEQLINKLNPQARGGLMIALAKLKTVEELLVDEEEKFKLSKGPKTKVEVGSYLAKRQDFEERLARLMGDIAIQIEKAA
jgi:hypothetical protein